MVDAGLAAVPVPVAEISQSQAPVVSQEPTPAAAAPAAPPAPPVSAPPASTTPSANNRSTDVEAGTVAKVRCKRKTTQNDHSHGSFFLRIGAIGKFFPNLSYKTFNLT